MLLISELKLNIDENENKLVKLIAKKLKIKDKDILEYRIHKKSLDARKDAVYKYQVLVKVKDEKRFLRIKNVIKYSTIDTGITKVFSNIRPLIIGYGPSGIFSAYRLVEAGLKPIIFEKGKRIKERCEDVEKFFKEGILNPNSNVQFGEGGAGTFSDAKLTTRIKDPFVNYILDVFVKFGAKESIKYTPHAHIGTDEIRTIISKITDYLIAEGASFHFEEEMEDLLIDENRNVIGIKTNKEIYKSPICLLGVGHSAYNAIKMLDEKGVCVSAKDMAIGFRVEHPQELINKNQVNSVNIKEASEYFLRYKDEKGVYSFCMCPGGFVIPASSDLNRVVTNGMSYADRSNNLANSAILLQVKKEEYPIGNLGGFEYIKEYETKAYNLSNSYKAIASNIKDFLNGTTNQLIFESSYPLKTHVYDFNKFFNSQDCVFFKKALIYFDSKIPGFIDQGIMVGPETRSSCPCRIDRNIDLESVNTKGLYPMGEGAGYGGGIMSCSLDGIRIANAVVSHIVNNS